ncbi:MAG: glycosyl hydrolase family 28 protein [Bacteroidales bacterium]|nr:glycosyl hydrolase family 28 protein [Bacteroidales bacterium]
MNKVFILFTLSLTLASVLNAKDYNILDFGAVRNQNSTAAIRTAVEVCSEAGGGTVIVPAGVFISGAIILKSNINLYLEQGAELRSSENLEDFVVGSGRYGMIFCQDAVNISITGEGTINAMGTQFYETDKNHTVSSGLGGTREYDRMLTRQKENYIPDGIFQTDGPLKRKPRPGMTIVFFHCNQITIKDITVKDTPVWAIRFSYCEDVLVEGISIQNNLMIPNSDGIHLTVSRNVRIANCEIRAGDDAIVVTGFARIEDTPGFDSKEQDKYIYGNKSIYAENIQVTNCHLQSRSSAIRIGYGQHPIRKIVFNNIVISESNRGIGIFAHDASDIEELIFSNIIIETRLHNGIWWGNGEPIHLSAVSRFPGQPAGRIKNVQFNNISATGGQGIIIYGGTQNRMENIQLNNVQLCIVKGRETLSKGGNFDLRPTADITKQVFEHDIPGLYAQYIDNLAIRDFRLTWGDGLPDFFTNGIECHEVSDLLIDRFTGSPNPNSPKSKKLYLEKCTTTRVE